ncbi:PREDICTED: transferring glycosyl group transferase [Prunus dulcis]|uniref:PREDICTED: transferring glycosyl group transferase n=1 Tax=Prunus dulcis TaxID=3755 RepID=A0A5E4G0C8_PRUDU|nr:uncharacterized protein LOC117619403 [Prunus dulcis]VVA33275.1 PREDICTED: transferring glycosyl group transferase [Prunus dulcis]
MINQTQKHTQPLFTMKGNQKDPAEGWTSKKITLCFLALISFLYISYSLQFVSPSNLCRQQQSFTAHVQSQPKPKVSLPPIPQPITDATPEKPQEAKTNISHIVFGIAASANMWGHRKNYIKLWWKADQMRGNVWLDQPVKMEPEHDHLLPPIKISSDTSKFEYKNPRGHQSAIRLSRIVSENFRLDMENVRWFVMGDDDTVFVTENLVRVLQKYDHNQFYYIGSSSESHLQNIYFSYNMAYGGGGIAISYPLAKALEKMQDRCIERYTGLYGSDDRLQACMAELGVPLTREKGFHQFDVYGSLFGLLAAHPVTPLVSLHHLDVFEPIFPNMDRVHALQRLQAPMKIDSAGLLQQSICYDKTRSWTVSVSWGYTIQIFRGIFSPREIEMPSRTFLNWYKKADYTTYDFNTRRFGRNPCQQPFVYYFSNVVYNKNVSHTATEYVRDRVPDPECHWKMANPSRIKKVQVYKAPNPHLWDKSPRRNCCRILPNTKKNGTMVIDVGACNEDEVVEVR